LGNKLGVIMKKFFLCFLVAAPLIFSDQIILPNYYTTNETVTGAKENANNRAIRSVVNGNLKDDNIHADAKISQSKIDSTSGWIKNNTGRFAQSEPFWFLRSQYGWKIMINDSTGFDREFIIISDSTDTIAIFGNDSVHILKDALFDGNVKSDSLICAKGARITKTTIADSANINTGVAADRGIFDSIKVAGGSWITSLTTGNFVMKMCPDGDTSTTLTNATASYYLLNNNVSLSFGFAADYTEFPYQPPYVILGQNLAAKYPVVGIPAALKVSTERTIRLPVSHTINVPGNVTGGYNTEVTLKLIPSGADTIVVAYPAWLGASNEINFHTMNISYTR
jgi:hypothetical protein